MRLPMSSPVPAIGQSVPRKEAVSKVTGRARYVDDVVLPGMIHGITVRSTCPRGTLKGIRFGEGIPWDRDHRGDRGRRAAQRGRPHQRRPARPRRRRHQPPARSPSSCSPTPTARCCRRRAPPSRSRSSRCPRSVTIDDALAATAVCGATTTSYKKFLIRKGDVSAAELERGRRRSARRRRRVLTGAQEQLYIEPTASWRSATRRACVTVWGSMQCPYYVHKALKPLFDCRPRSPRGPGRDGRRLRRQGRVSVDDRRARRAARVEIAASP